MATLKSPLAEGPRCQGVTLMQCRKPDTTSSVKMSVITSEQNRHEKIHASSRHVKAILLVEVTCQALWVIVAVSWES